MISECRLGRSTVATKREECRVLADHANNADMKGQYRAVATQWEELAAEAERLERVRHNLSKP